GFGRIGRLVLRAFCESHKKYDFEIVAINDLLNIDCAIHLLKYDSVHGRLNCDIRKISDKEISIDGRRLAYISEKSPTNLPWKNLKIDLVLECTGIFKTKSDSQTHLKAGAKKVLISAPSKDADKTIVFGVNDDSIDINKDITVSNASCTTNCLAPIIKAIHEEIGILNGFATTIHSYTGDQRLVDMNHKDIRRSRAAAMNIIPTSTGATNAIEKIFPELKGKLSGLSVRVPTPNVSMLDFTFTTAKKSSINDINEMIIKYADGKLKNVLGYTKEPLVSLDFNHSPLSSIVDLTLTDVINSTIAHIVAWYDNEWGFANRILDTAEKMF
ncbi:MAG: type I glyceraldehyde-3-phosphate dehydrogenase, partial [Holosporaceae bacterium]|nr:type I glyceraldehyde-3-phosphate dehydrogenase [Holosporaceae bacterium]